MNATTMDSRSTREQWRDVLDTVTTGQTDVVVTRNKKPAVVIIPFNDYEMILEHLDDVRSAKLAQAVYEHWKNGSITARPLAEVRARLLEDSQDETIHRADHATSRETIRGDANRRQEDM